MEVVFEIVSRGGHTIERHRVSGDRITIGRAFDNQLILTDETVSPHHAVLEADAQGNPVLIDNGSLNGVRSDRHGAGSRIAIGSGATCNLGRARIRIYLPKHPVAETIRMGELDGLINRVGTLPVLGFMAIAVAGVTVTELWLTSYSGMEWGQIGIGLFSVFSAATMVGILLAIIGRVAKHEGRMQTQLALVLLYLLLQSTIVFAYEIVLYNTLNPWASAAIGLVASFLLLATTLWICLHVATNLGSRQRWQFAVAFTTVLLCVSVYPEFVARGEFSDTPRYVKQVKPPQWRVAGGIDRDTFVARTNETFESIDDDLP
ncbi:MAG: FHA domain-containing protein [Gammaproteobacteria bacterium]|jgi:hypothetical protein